MSEEKKRYIPKKVSDAVKQRDSFQCAWCCEALTERHHIEEYSEGGENSLDNLILLCPNCHTDVHLSKTIDKDELKKRTSTHNNNDRISGGLRVSTNELRFVVNDNLYIQAENLITYNEEILLSAKLLNGNILISTRLYDLEVNLVLWMNKNRYWANSNFFVGSSSNYLEIKNSRKENIFKIEVVKDVLTLSIDFKYQKTGLEYGFNDCVIRNNTFYFCGFEYEEEDYEAKKT